MVQSGTYASHPAAFLDQPFAAPHQSFLSTGSEVPLDKKSSFPPGEAKRCKPLACTLYYRAGTNRPKCPRRMNLRGLCVYCGCVNQAISLTVMLTSGMASVELLTSILPERICSFTALYSSTVKCSMLQVSVGRPTYSPSSRPKLVTLPP